MKQQSDNSREQFLMPARDMLEIEQPVSEVPLQQNHFSIRAQSLRIAIIMCFFFILDILLTVQSIGDISHNQSIGTLILFVIMVLSNILIIAIVVISYKKYKEKRKKKDMHNTGS